MKTWLVKLEDDDELVVDADYMQTAFGCLCFYHDQGNGPALLKMTFAAGAWNHAGQCELKIDVDTTGTPH